MHRVNMFGIPIDVASDADIEKIAEKAELHPYVVGRCADMSPTAGSPALRQRRLRTLCELCGEVCWQDPKSFDQVRALNTLIVCTVCMQNRNDEITALVAASRNR